MNFYNLSKTTQVTGILKHYTPILLNHAIYKMLYYMFRKKDPLLLD